MKTASIDTCVLYPRSLIVKRKNVIYLLLERSFRQKIFMDPKNGKICDITAHHRISLIQACFDFQSKQFQLVCHATFLSKLN